MKLSVALAAFLATAAFGGAITYTESAYLDGNLNGSSFSDALVTITLTADTSGITTGGPGQYYLAGTLATVSVAGGGSDTLTDPYIVIMSQGNEFVDIQNATYEILGTGNSALATYALNTSLGPVSGRLGYNPNVAFATTSGSFTVTGVESSNSTFTATLSGAAVPEPGTFVLAGVAMVALRLCLRRTA